jgi:hypothetical protein
MLTMPQKYSMGFKGLNSLCFKNVDIFAAFQMPLPSASGIAQSTHAPLCQFHCEFV